MPTEKHHQYLIFSPLQPENSSIVYPFGRNRLASNEASELSQKISPRSRRVQEYVHVLQVSPKFYLIDHFVPKENVFG